MITTKIKIIIISILVVATGLADLYILASMNYRSYETRMVVIQKGDGLKQVAMKLGQEKVINSPLVFTAYAVITQNSKKIKAGNYEFQGVEGIPQILDILTEGLVVEKKITIIEGWDLKNIGEYLERNGLGSADEFYYIAGKPLYLNKAIIENDCRNLTGIGSYDYREKYPFLSDKPENINLEGYLFPDTYNLPLNPSIESVIQIALNNFDKKMTPEMRSEISRQNKSIFEIIIMASLLEKEVKTPQEKKIVSGILWKRLSINMPLQVDSTVLYSLGPQNRVSYTDTTTCSPYNTYRRKGLPIGPISNPGIDSILAAIYPIESDYLYYLSAEDGTTYFSKTLEEHNIKKEKYLK